MAFPTVWTENSPDALLELCVRRCTRHPETLCGYQPFPPGYVLREGLLLPQEICERMLRQCHVDASSGADDHLHRFVNVFRDSARTRVSRVDLSGTGACDTDLEAFCGHTLSELDISGCKQLTQGALTHIGRMGRLRVLNVGSASHIFSDDSKIAEDPEVDHLPHHHYMGLFSSSKAGLVAEEATTLSDQPATTHPIELPLLRHLGVHGLAKADLNPCFMQMLRSTDYLTHLDVSRCDLPDDFGECLMTKNLSSLVMCDVLNIKDLVPFVCQIKTLRHLDISSSEFPILYDNPNQTLKMIVESLQDLVSLDISGTNLAGTRTIVRFSKMNTSKQGKKCSEPQQQQDGMDDGGARGEEEEDRLTDIPGLESRVSRPLQFLGLLNTAHDACYRHHIPAKRIAGDATEAQVLTAGVAYVSREHMIQKVLNDLFQIFRVSSCADTRLALDVVMEAMRRHLKAKHIQVSGSASLFYIVKGDHKHLFNIKMRRQIIKVLIDAMFSHYSDVTMLRNGCLTLIHFKIPEDVFFDYERLASLLLLIVAQEEQDDFVQRIGVYLLNSLACQVDGIEKKLVGDRGAITIMCQVIEKRLHRHVCDEVMETAWSTMWNVTDETPINCERFLEGKGMDLFLGCLQAFPQKAELLRNMMGLLGNVAEVKDLRRYLMKDEYLSVFSELLGSKSDGIEVSYNAAGILSHIVSDGPDAWAAHGIASIKRGQVLARLVEAVERWSLSTRRNINYRSFRPILRLLTVEHTPEARHWAVWALANLTTVYPEKYCGLLRGEGGIQLLRNGNYINPSCQRICELAAITILNCDNYDKNKTSDNSEGSEYFEANDDSLDLQ